MNAKVRTRIEDALKAARLIQTWASTNSFELFTSDPKTEAAYLHEFIRIGETLRILRDVDLEFEIMIANVHQWIGLRHRLIHDYREIDLELLWISATTEIPGLIVQLESILEQ